jgi:hypothetical protein
MSGAATHAIDGVSVLAFASPAWATGRTSPSDAPNAVAGDRAHHAAASASARILSYGNGEGEFHTGIDISAPIGHTHSRHGCRNGEVSRDGERLRT